MSSTHPDFPVAQWPKLITQANITLNLMRLSRINPQLSAYAQIFGQFDYQKTLMPPPGMKVLAHVLPSDRRSFDTHAIKAISVGPAMEHYRCFKVYIPSTGGVHIADTVRWFPHDGLKMPVPSKEALLQATLEGLRAALKSAVKNNILPPEGTNSRDILLQLNDIFQNKDKRTNEANPTQAPTLAPSALPSVVPAPAPTQVPTALPRVVPVPAPTQVPTAFPKVVPTLARRSTRNRTSTKSPTFHYANSTITLSQLEESYIQRIFPVNAILNKTTGTLEE